MLTTKGHGVEISIAGCIEEMVHDTNPIPFFLFFYFFYFLFCIIYRCNLLLSIVRSPEGDLAILEGQGGQGLNEIPTTDIVKVRD